MNKEIKLSDSFTYKRLIQFSLPSIGVMIFTSIYGVVDGIFISNFADEVSFAAVNFMYPYLMFFISFGYMIGTGGSALISFFLGMGEKKKADEAFTELVVTVAAVGVFCTVIGQIFIRPVAVILGGSDEMLRIGIKYGRIFLSTMTAFIMQCAMQNFLITTERPQLGFKYTVAAGVTNMVLDALFIGVFRWGVVGAAIATCLGMCVGGIGPVLYFASQKNDSLLHFRKYKPDLKVLTKTLSNGASEFLMNASLSIVNMEYNYQLLKYFGEYGISAYGVIMYVSFIFSGTYYGYSMAVAPIGGFHLGAGNGKELKSLVKKSIIMTLASAAVLTVLAEIFAKPLAGVFTGSNPDLWALSSDALRLYSTSYIFFSVNIFVMSFFAGLNKGMISTVISFLKGIGLQSLFIFTMPILFGEDSIWLAVTAAEFCTLIVSTILMANEYKGFDHIQSVQNTKKE